MRHTVEDADGLVDVAADGEVVDRHVADDAIGVNEEEAAARDGTKGRAGRKRGSERASAKKKKASNAKTCAPATHGRKHGLKRQAHARACAPEGELLAVVVDEDAKVTGNLVVAVGDEGHGEGREAALLARLVGPVELDKLRVDRHADDCCGRSTRC